MNHLKLSDPNNNAHEQKSRDIPRTELWSFCRGLNEWFSFLTYYPVLYLLADVSEHFVGSIFWVEVIEDHHFEPEDVTDKVFRNVG